MPSGESAPADVPPPTRRPFVAEHTVAVYESRGYIIAGTRHKLMCRCYACKVVRRRGREKRLRQELFNCG